jgi:hypothetical protein
MKFDRQSPNSTEQKMVFLTTTREKQKFFSLSFFFLFGTHTRYEILFPSNRNECDAVNEQQKFLWSSLFTSTIAVSSRKRFLGFLCGFLFFSR